MSWNWSHFALSQLAKLKGLLMLYAQSGHWELVLITHGYCDRRIRTAFGAMGPGGSFHTEYGRLMGTTERGCCWWHVLQHPARLYRVNVTSATIGSTVMLIADLTAEAFQARGRGMSLNALYCCGTASSNSHNEITVVVWRTGPSVKSSYEGLIHRPSYKPSPSAYEPPSPPSKKRDKTPPAVPPLPAHHRTRRLLINGSEGGGGGGGGGGVGWGGERRGEELDAKGRATGATPQGQHTHTLRGTRVKASNGDNYIILSPINPGSQILRPVYPDGHGTLAGRVLSSQQASGPHMGGVGRTNFLRRSTNSKTSKSVPTGANHQPQSSQNYANYQNCTIVRSHLPTSHANYGTYVKVPPKILIFPIFVQPIDLCNPNRTLVVSEEMILHESKHHSLKVTVFIYTDLMLVTREDDPGRCNVLQNPLYLKQLRLQEGE
ncbi:hypothetical protein AALO_G00159970 [Alosa alosa]|uniref:Uncharacterized protein n=1 Tax=Alosa alosa TaxID=278164 RepID=A0AAV6GEZ5_9TELE|nr:hypothetical protein AALO_G00159970 [Alosa alosa]